MPGIVGSGYGGGYAGSSLPSQAGHTGQFLHTDGTLADWKDVKEGSSGTQLPDNPELGDDFRLTAQDGTNAPGFYLCLTAGTWTFQGVPTGAGYVYAWNQIKAGAYTIAAGTVIVTSNGRVFSVIQSIAPNAAVRSIDPGDYDEDDAKTYFEPTHLEDVNFNKSSGGEREYTFGEKNNGHYRETEIVFVLDVSNNAIDHALKISETEGLVLIKKKGGNNAPAVDPYDSTTYDSDTLFTTFQGSPKLGDSLFATLTQALALSDTEHAINPNRLGQVISPLIATTNEMYDEPKDSIDYHGLTQIGTDSKITVSNSGTPSGTEIYYRTAAWTDKPTDVQGGLDFIGRDTVRYFLGVDTSQNDVLYKRDGSNWESITINYLSTLNIGAIWLHNWRAAPQGALAIMDPVTEPNSTWGDFVQLVFRDGDIIYLIKSSYSTAHSRYELSTYEGYIRVLPKITEGDRLKALVVDADARLSRWEALPNITFETTLPTANIKAGDFNVFPAAATVDLQVEKIVREGETAGFGQTDIGIINNFLRIGYSSLAAGANFTGLAIGDEIVAIAQDGTSTVTLEINSTPSWTFHTDYIQLSSNHYAISGSFVDGKQYDVYAVKSTAITKLSWVKYLDPYWERVLAA